MSERREGERGDALFRAWSESTESPPFDEEAGRARFLGALQARRPRSRASRFVFLAAAAALLAAVLLFARWRAGTTPHFTAGESAGQVGAWLATSQTSEMPIAFSEGTRLVIAPDSRGRVEDLAPEGATFLLERGEVRAKVVHQRTTSWRFVAGPFEVHVTGTALRVEWDPTQERFAVRVDEGSVTLRGPHVGGLQVVRAGERCVVDLPARTIRLSPVTADAGVPEVVPSGTSSSSENEAPSAVPVLPAPSALARPSWTALEAKGNYDAAHAAAVSAGLPTVLATASADELLRLAQVGRLSGHRDTERDALLACRKRFGGKGQAAVAAYELGRASSPAEAASWFETYLREQPSGPLGREALGRLVEARVAMGDTPAARIAATRYLERYPDGPQAPLSQRVLGGGVE